MQKAFKDLVDGEPHLRALLKAADQRIADVMELALDKVVAHLDDPKDHPLPADRNSIEWGLYRLVERKSDGDKRRLARKLKDRLDPKARRQRYGDLADIPLTAATPVFEQAKTRIKAGFAVPAAADRQRILAKLEALRPAPAKEVAADKPARGRRVALAGRATPRGGVAARFALRVERAECVQKTRELFEGADEMALTVSLFTADDLIRAVSQTRDTFDLGSFDQDQVRGVEFETRQATIGAAEGLPTAIFAILVAAEKDRFEQGQQRTRPGDRGDVSVVPGGRSWGANLRAGADHPGRLGPCHHPCRDDRRRDHRTWAYGRARRASAAQRRRVRAEGRRRRGECGRRRVRRAVGRACQRPDGVQHQQAWPLPHRLSI
ncbi:MAG: hypothetical protein R3F55_22585 [Alphaproteobacteria bacterium]